MQVLVNSQKKSKMTCMKFNAISKIQKRNLFLIQEEKVECKNEHEKVSLKNKTIEGGGK